MFGRQRNVARHRSYRQGLSVCSCYRRIIPAILYSRWVVCRHMSVFPAPRTKNRLSPKCYRHIALPLRLCPPENTFPTSTLKKKESPRKLLQFGQRGVDLIELKNSPKVSISPFDRIESILSGEVRPTCMASSHWAEAIRRCSGIIDDHHRGNKS